MRRSFHTVGNPPTGRSVGSFGISEGNIAGRGKRKKEKKNKPTEYMPNHNSQQKSSPRHLHPPPASGAEQRGEGCMLRVRTGPECPGDNLRELM